MTKRHWLFAIAIASITSLGALRAFGSFGQYPGSFGIMAGVQRIGVGSQSVNPTWPLEVGGTYSSVSGVADGVSVYPTLKATANNDTLNGVLINPTFTNGAFSGVTDNALKVVGTISATSFSGGGSFTNLVTTGTNTLGTAGVAFHNMGVCTIASTTLSTTSTNETCTGVPAAAAVAVTCTGNAAFSTATANGLYCYATGTASQLACNTIVANTTAMAYTCSWVQP